MILLEMMMRSLKVSANKEKCYLSSTHHTLICHLSFLFFLNTHIYRSICVCLNRRAKMSNYHMLMYGMIRIIFLCLPYK